MTIFIYALFIVIIYKTPRPPTLIRDGCVPKVIQQTLVEVRNACLSSSVHKNADQSGKKASPSVQFGMKRWTDCGWTDVGAVNTDFVHIG